MRVAKYVLEMFSFIADARVVHIYSFNRESSAQPQRSAKEDPSEEGEFLPPGP